MKSLQILLLLFCALNVSAQVTTEDTLSLFYSKNYDLFEKDFDKDQIPLDGKEVDMIPFRQDDKFGFVDKVSGQLIIKPQYKEVHAVYREGAIVKSENGYGLINHEGKAVIPLQFRQLKKENDIYTGLLSLVDEKTKEESYNSIILSMHFDKNGKFLFEEYSHDYQMFQGNDSLAWFRYGTTYHIRSKSGRLLKTFHYKPGTHFTSICRNLLVFAEEKKEGEYLYSAYDIKDPLVFNLTLHSRVDGVYRLSENLFGNYLKDGDFLFTDEKGNEKNYGIVSRSVGFFIYNGDFFQTNHYVVKNFDTDKFGIIDSNANFILPFTYNSLYKIGKDSFLCNGTRFINEKGNTITPYQIDRKSLDWLSSNNLPLLPKDGRYLVNSYKIIQDKDQKGNVRTIMDGNNTVFYFVDSNHHKIIDLPNNYIFVSEFSEGLAAFVDSTRKLGFIDTNGKVAIRPEYELSMAGSYPLPYIITPTFINGYAYIKSFKGYIDRKGKKYFTGKRLSDHYNFSH